VPEFDATQRKQALYSTEAAPALGLSKYATPAAVWAIKRGLSEAKDISGKFEVRLGRHFQEAIIALHETDTGELITRLSTLDLTHRVEGLTMGSHFDGVNYKTERLHEVKFFSPGRLREFGEPGSGDVPWDVLVQCLHEMTVYAHARAAIQGVEVNVLFGNEARHLYVVPWDEAAIAKLIDQEREFWQLVQSGTPPPARSPEDCRKIWARTNGSSKIADQHTALACSALREVKTLIKRYEQSSDNLETEIESYMAEASTLTAPDGTRLATWSAAKPAHRIDSDKLREKYPAIAEECTKIGEAQRRFLLK
jgi:predicted phage-related endonuclease